MNTNIKNTVDEKSASVPSLTIYNQGFAVVRDVISLDIGEGESDLIYDGATLGLEADSVILRDISGKPLQVLEQNYRNDPVTQALLLSFFEGREIDFVVREPHKPDRSIRGKIIRSGYIPQENLEDSEDSPKMGEPIIEVDGKIQFGLPGQPLFPSLGNDMILKPRISWKIRSETPIQGNAEVAYLTEGLAWNVSYNVVVPENGTVLNLVGWVTMNNQCGRDFVNAKIKLLAGDVNKESPHRFSRERKYKRHYVCDSLEEVTEKTLDEYHLYTLARATTLRNCETKQIELIRASGIESKVRYEYVGLVNNWSRWDENELHTKSVLDLQSQSQIAVVREFENTKANGLGIPLPKGRMRFYRADGTSLEFTGENTIEHTPNDEKISILTGHAFDLVGKHERKEFKVNAAECWCSESIEVTLRNHKKESATIHVIERIFRAANWKITEQSDLHHKIQSDAIEFVKTILPGKEEKIRYTVRYSW